MALRESEESASKIIPARRFFFGLGLTQQSLEVALHLKSLLESGEELATFARAVNTQVWADQNICSEESYALTNC